jgi:thiol-disulfide isomerase/thioredoxin
MSIMRFALLILIAALIAACQPAAAPATTPPTVPPTIAPAGGAPTAAPPDALEVLPEPPEEGEAGASASWLALPLIDARTGGRFTLADFRGRTVFVEPMATWCSNCRMQQNTVREVRNQLNDDGIVFLSLSVETALSPAQLLTYAERQNYGWSFAVSTPELLEALVGHFGRTVSNPPSTPHFIIAPDGTVSALSTGQHSAEQIISALDAARGA